jgi:hypothetical protein
MIRVLRKASSPARVLTPSPTLPTVEWSFGVSPSHCELAPGLEQARIGRLHEQHEAPTSPTPESPSNRML